MHHCRATPCASAFLGVPRTARCVYRSSRSSDARCRAMQHSMNYTQLLQQLVGPRGAAGPYGEHLITSAFTPRPEFLNLSKRRIELRNQHMRLINKQRVRPRPSTYGHDAPEVLLVSEQLSRPLQLWDPSRMSASRTVACLVSAAASHTAASPLQALVPVGLLEVQRLRVMHCRPGRFGHMLPLALAGTAVCAALGGAGHTLLPCKHASPVRPVIAVLWQGTRSSPGTHEYRQFSVTAPQSQSPWQPKPARSLCGPCFACDTHYRVYGGVGGGGREGPT